MWVEMCLCLMNTVFQCVPLNIEKRRSSIKDVKKLRKPKASCEDTDGKAERQCLERYKVIRNEYNRIRKEKHFEELRRQRKWTLDHYIL